MTIKDQPPPIPMPERTPVWTFVISDIVIRLAKAPAQITGLRDKIIADMEARDLLGRERYGTPLTAHNGRDPLVDAYQEALDCSVYLRQYLEEHGYDNPIAPLYDHTLEIVVRMRHVIDIRDRVVEWGKTRGIGS